MVLKLLCHQLSDGKRGLATIPLCGIKLPLFCYAFSTVALFKFAQRNVLPVCTPWPRTTMATETTITKRLRPRQPHRNRSQDQRAPRLVGATEYRKHVEPRGANEDTLSRQLTHYRFWNGL